MGERQWINFYDLLDAIYHNEVITHKLKIIDKNDKVWHWKNEIESFVMPMSENNVEPPFLYITDTYSEMELSELDVKIVPHTVEFIKEEDALSMKKLMQEIQRMPLETSDRVYVRDNMENIWYWDSNKGKLVGTDNRAVLCRKNDNDETEVVDDDYGDNYDGELFTDIHNDLEMASVEFEILKTVKSKDTFKASALREIDNCILEIKTRLDIIETMADKLKECE